MRRKPRSREGFLSASFRSRPVAKQERIRCRARPGWVCDGYLTKRQPIEPPLLGDELVEERGCDLLAQSEKPLPEEDLVLLRSATKLVDCRAMYHKLLNRQVARASAQESTPQLLRLVMLKHRLCAAPVRRVDTVPGERRPGVLL